MRYALAYQLMSSMELKSLVMRGTAVAIIMRSYSCEALSAVCSKLVAHAGEGGEMTYQSNKEECALEREEDDGEFETGDVVNVVGFPIALLSVSPGQVIAALRLLDGIRLWRLFFQRGQRAGARGGKSRCSDHDDLE
jgi:hypothetical protein